MFHFLLEHADYLEQLHGSPHLFLLLVVAVGPPDLLEVLPTLIHQHLLQQPHSHLLLSLPYLLW